MKRRRWLRCGAALAGVYLLPVSFGWMNPSTPVDYAMNCATFAHDPNLEAARDGRQRLVVLQHGLWRSAGSLWKLERALRDHGYEVLNVSYPSTAATIEVHAQRLQDTLEAALAGRDLARLELSFVGHSMGGLVIRQYLQQQGARPAACVVFLGTPQHGASLCDLRREWWLFQLFMGDQAAVQLSPSHPFWQQLRPPSCPFGLVIGGVGTADGRHGQIPGDDDGTVGVAEARLPGATDEIVLPLQHTFLSFRDAAITQVLAFLRARRFRK